MTGTPATLAFAALASLVFAGLATVAFAVLWPPLLRASSNRPPAARARYLVWLAAGPAVGGIAATALCFLPAVANLLGIGRDHCLHHQDGHAHFCFVHHPSLHGPMAYLVLAVVLGVVAGTILLHLRASVRARRLLASLGAVSTQGDEAPALVDSDLPFAASAGWWRPRVFLSRRLAQSLNPSRLAVVVAHERAHAARRDGLWTAIVSVLSLAHLPATRRALREAHSLACEQACDECAAEEVCDRVAVAEVILVVERLLTGAMPAPSPAFGGGCVATRVEALLADPAPSVPSHPVRRLLFFSLAMATLAVIANPLHHATETILGVLLH